MNNRGRSSVVRWQLFTFVVVDASTFLLGLLFVNDSPGWESHLKKKGYSQKRNGGPSLSSCP